MNSIWMRVKHKLFQVSALKLMIGFLLFVSNNNIVLRNKDVMCFPVCQFSVLP